MKQNIMKINVKTLILVGIAITMSMSLPIYAYGPGDTEQTYFESETTNTTSGEVVGVAEDESKVVVNIPKQATHYNFYYEQLNDTEKLYYIRILSAIIENKDTCDVGCVPLETVYKVLTAVYNDNPEIVSPDVYKFSQHGYEGKEQMITYFTGLTEESVNEFNQCKDLASLALGEIYSTLDGDYSQQNIVKHIYDYLAMNVDYDLSVANNQDVRSVFFSHRSICAGYAKAFQYLCNLAGVDCTIIVGYADGGIGLQNHAWNLVRFDDNTFRYYDVTFGDSYNNKAINYDYYDSPTNFANHFVQDNLIGETSMEIGTPLWFAYPNAN